ncbi:MAG: decaprenyl-phosphate phosphoribosyltransferase, partial [Planctomycetes bacterium]|nr:decaprenyl-phosphate phosphoribosyltransferase [Planctomycetota bacterium]
MLPAPLRAMRPHQWVKNVFVLAALGFALGDKDFVLQPGTSLHVALAFLAFSFGASAIYLVNDILDVEADRAHPTKCRRPIAARELAIPTAWMLGLGLAVGALILAYFASPSFALPGVVLAYMTMNLFYSLQLKHIVIVDVFCIATGFLLRVVGGGLAVGAPVSHWLLLCTLFLALFLGFNKRRAELAAVEEREGSGAATTGVTRASLSGYDLAWLDQVVTLIAACTILCYALYTVDPATTGKFPAGDRLIWSLPFVVFAVLRYMYLVMRMGHGESPTRILLGGDR